MGKNKLIICTGYETCLCNCPGKEAIPESMASQMADNCYHDSNPCCHDHHSDGMRHECQIVDALDLKRAEIISGFAKKLLGDMKDSPAWITEAVDRHFWGLI